MKLNALDKLALAIVWSRIKKKIKEIKKMSEAESKPWYLSRGVIAGLMTMVIGIAGAFGVDGLDVEKDQITEIILSVVTAIVGAVAVWGRVKAKQQVTLIKEK